MTDPIETAVKTEVSNATSSLEARVKALEAGAEGYVKAHVVWFVAAIALIAGFVAGHLIR